MIRFVLALIFALPGVSYADIVVSPFGSNGEGGSVNGHTFTFGSGGNVYELDAFVNIAGYDLNGTTVGTSAQLSQNSLPSGVAYSFEYELSPDNSDLTLTYTITNNSGALLNDFGFFSFVDSEIDEPTNTYFNEFAQTFGTLGTGSSDDQPDSFEVDEPGYVFGDIFDNLRLGSLDNTNNVDSSFPDDVSMALGFSTGDLLDNQIATISIFLSEDGDSISNFSIRHSDSDASSNDQFTFSGVATVTTVVPEPSGFALLGCLSPLLFVRKRNQG